MDATITYLDQQEAFDEAMRKLRGAPWIGFDTEFVGEKTYIPVFCLLQIVADKVIYLVDVLVVKELTAFFDLLTDPDTLKITHAGDNDYRLLHTLYNVTPVNTFDTQIAAGFVGYNYPAGFGRIVEREIGITLAKSHTVANWEARPLDNKALEYAVEDVKYLHVLYEKLTKRLRKQQRENWAREENRKWENPAFYLVDPNKEAFGNDFIHQLSFREQVFLLRIFRWRRDKALEYNLPKETILQARHIGSIVRAVKGGVNAFKANRTLNEGVWRKYLPDWEHLWQEKATETETTLLKTMPPPPPDDPDHEWNMELLYHFVKKQCLVHEISAALLLPKGDFNKLKNGGNFDNELLGGWRGELLGGALVSWLQRGGDISVNWNGTQCVLMMNAE